MPVKRRRTAKRSTNKSYYDGDDADYIITRTQQKHTPTRVLRSNAHRSVSPLPPPPQQQQRRPLLPPRAQERQLHEFADDVNDNVDTAMNHEHDNDDHDNEQQQLNDGRLIEFYVVSQHQLELLLQQRRQQQKPPNEARLMSSFNIPPRNEPLMPYLTQITK